MNVTERQKEILNSVVEEYIYSAQPVSSQLLEKRYDFEISPATIRIEMQKLTEAGFIHQPHTSAGRIPTDKGYRFFVNDLLEKGFFREDVDFEMKNLINKEIKDTFKFVQSVTKNLALLSSNLALGYLFNEKILWKEGWEEIIQEPEFKEMKLITNFAGLIRNFEEEIEEFKIDSRVQVFIGKENPFPKAKDFSIIISRCQFPSKEEGILAIAGPKRMTYEKNISSLNSLARLLENL